MGKSINFFEINFKISSEKENNEFEIFNDGTIIKVIYI